MFLVGSLSTQSILHNTLPILLYPFIKVKRGLGLDPIIVSVGICVRVYQCLHPYKFLVCMMSLEPVADFHHTCRTTSFRQFG